MSEITPTSTVSMHLDIRLKDGSMADSTRSLGEPMRFTMGEEVFSDKLEASLVGLKAGDKTKVMLLPHQAFGEPHPANIFEVPRSRFKDMPAEELEPGNIIAFAQLDGREMPGIIRSVQDQEVTVDFNHPLAGEVVLFDIEIVEVSHDAS